MLRITNHWIRLGILSLTASKDKLDMSERKCYLSLPEEWQIDKMTS